MQKYLIVFVIIVLLITGLVIFSSKDKAVVGVTLNISGTNTSSTVTTTAKQVLASFDGAQIRWITNTGATTTFLSFSSTSTGNVLNQGYALLPSQTLEMTDAKGNLWAGTVWGIAPATATLSIFQF